MLLRPRAIAFVATGLCLTGAAAELSVLPRAIPKREGPIAIQAPRVSFDEARTEQLLARLGPTLSPEVRTKVADALVSEARRNGYDPLFLLAMIGVESNYRLAAHSQRGARGLLQLKPSTFAWMAPREPDVAAHALESGDDPAADVRLAVRYFRYLEHRFESRNAALMAYNAGPKRVWEARRAGEFPERLLGYPQRVRKEYERVIRLADENRPRMADHRLLLARVP